MEDIWTSLKLKVLRLTTPQRQQRPQRQHNAYIAHNERGI
jgi:hypothetical protein